jgi:hypothetical protein
MGVGTRPRRCQRRAIVERRQASIARRGALTWPRHLSPVSFSSALMMRVPSAVETSMMNACSNTATQRESQRAGNGADQKTRRCDADSRSHGTPAPLCQRARATQRSARVVRAHATLKSRWRSSPARRGRGCGRESDGRLGRSCIGGGEAAHQLLLLVYGIHRGCFLATTYRRCAAVSPIRRTREGLRHAGAWPCPHGGAAPRRLHHHSRLRSSLQLKNASSKVCHLPLASLAVAFTRIFAAGVQPPHPTTR